MDLARFEKLPRIDDGNGPMTSLAETDDRVVSLARGMRDLVQAEAGESERVRTLIARAEDDWLVVVQDSLRRNRGTLAVQSMDRLLGEHGELEALRQRGYQVEGP